MGLGPTHQWLTTEPLDPQDPAPLTSRPTPHLGHHRHHSQPCLRTISPISRLAIDLGSLALQPPTLETGSAHHWPSLSLEPLGLHSQPPHDSVLLTSGQQPPHKAGPDNQPDWGDSHAYPTIPSSQPATTEGLM